jgi:DNA-binding transcriptional MerR regulator
LQLSLKQKNTTFIAQATHLAMGLWTQNMRKYHITELEQLSGIKAHTIRIWEKRYQLIEPERSGTNIRMYSDEQVRKLLNVATLLANGFKISRIAALNPEELAKKVQELQGGEHKSDAITISYINQFVASLLDLNEPAFERTYSAVVTRYGLYDGMTKVFYPLMRKIGLLWAMGEVMPVEEHFASVIIRRKLLSAIDGQVPAQGRGKKYLLMLPPDEWHEIGLLFSDFILRSAGVPTLYLGSNVPYENLPSLFSKTKISHVLTFLITRRDVAELQSLRENMGLPPDVKLLVAGNPNILKSVKQEKNTQLLLAPDDLLKIV